MNELIVYQVKYRVFGADIPYKKFFLSKEEAYEFYNRKDYADKPVVKIIKNQHEIEQYEELIKTQNIMDADNY